MKTAEVRQKFLEYFETKGHTLVPSASIVPENDPTLLFTNAGMNQFKDCFLGAEKRDYSRAASSQKVIRISGKHNDLENVGQTARHHTFFEMLGNFSFGDYFKEDAVKFAWEFVTEVLGIDKKRLWATVHESDEEAKEIWLKHTDVNPERVLMLGEDNFWSMGETGPCGPSSEIFYYLGDDVEGQSEEEFLKDDGTYMEIWNLVFMQYDRAADGTMNPLPMQSVDTGSGLERVACVMQGVKSNYDTDILRGLISKVEELSGAKYDGSSYEVRDLRKDKDYARDVAMRVIADHSRTIAFAIAEGVTPSSDGRGYVIRRVLRRAIRHGRVLKFKEPFLAAVCEEVINIMGSYYSELVEHKDTILRIVDAEERKFYETLDSGLEILQKEAAKVKKGKLFPGEVAFTLHDTYGFPLDLTQDALKAYDLEVDVPAFEAAMAKQKKRSRDDRKSQGIVYSATKIDADSTCFLGYSETEAESELLEVLGEGDEVALVFKDTPFYAESGGQVGDTGIIEFGGAKFEVSDTQKSPEGHFIHAAKLVDGDAASNLKGEKAKLIVDAERRERIKRNHTATHLLHSALRTVLGDHVKQAGSRVDDKTLRFDYSHFEQVSPEQLIEIQSFINEQVRANHEVITREMPVDEARKAGAMALFGEKYGDVVRVVEVGPQSLELCGGTHASRSGDIGFSMIASEGGISSGVRRIEAWAGSGADQALATQRAEFDNIGSLLKSGTVDLPEKVERLLDRSKMLEKELESMKGRLASSASGDLVHKTRTSPSGIKVIAEKVDGADSKTLRNMVDKLRQEIGSGVVALGAKQGDSALIVAGVTGNLTDTLNAGTLVKKAAGEHGGKGGGRADFAQAGGVELAELGQALDRLFELVS